MESDDRDAGTHGTPRARGTGCPHRHPSNHAGVDEWQSRARQMRGAVGHRDATSGVRWAHGHGVGPVRGSRHGARCDGPRATRLAGIRDPAVLRAMRDVPRHEFVPDDLRRHAYDDGPLAIGEGQTISQPFVVAKMIEALELAPTDRVLEVGTGSGYAAAILARIAREVFTVERHAVAPAWPRPSASPGSASTACVVGAAGDVLGWPAEAPFDAILVSAGRPAGPADPARAARDRWPDGHPGRRPPGPPAPRSGSSGCRERLDRGESFGDVSFVPLVGQEAWASSASRTPGGWRGTGSSGRSAPWPA